jgi:hypothetical protein
MTDSSVLAVACLTTIMSGGCSGGDGDKTSMTTGPEPSAPPSSVAMATDPAALIGKPQGQTLKMSAGPSTNRFTITALPPPQHTWDVNVEAPMTADVAVRIRTWYGQRLRVLDTTHDQTSCRVQGGRSVCSLAFPRLEAQRPGEWTVIVVKRSQPAALVRVEVIFNKE